MNYIESKYVNLLSGRLDKFVRKKEGLWKSWNYILNADGQKKSEGKYKADKKEGEWTYWYDDGALKEIGKYRADKKEG